MPDLPQWPDGLPSAPLRDGYSESQASAVIRTDMDAGPARVRRRTSAHVTDITARYLFNDAQMDTFMAFFNQDAGAGAVIFAMPHPRTGETVSARFRTPPQARALQRGYSFVDVSLEIMP